MSEMKSQGRLFVTDTHILFPPLFALHHCLLKTSKNLVIVYGKLTTTKD